MWRSQCESLRSRDAIVSVNTVQTFCLCAVYKLRRGCFLFLNMSLTGVRGGRVQQYLQRMGGFQCEDNPHVSYVCFWRSREAASACEAVFIASGVCTALGLLCVLLSVRGFVWVPPWRLRFWYFRCSRTGSKPLSWTVASCSERCTLNLSLLSDICLTVYIRCTKEIINHQNDDGVSVSFCIWWDVLKKCLGHLKFVSCIHCEPLEEHRCFCPGLCLCCWLYEALSTAVDQNNVR